MSVFRLTITTPEKMIFDSEVSKVTLPTTEGIITVHAHHIPLVAELKVGEIIVTDSSGAQHIFVSMRGYITVLSQRVTILVEKGELLSALAEETLAHAKQRAEELMEHPSDHLSEPEIRLREHELEYLLTRQTSYTKWIR